MADQKTKLESRAAKLKEQLQQIEARQRAIDARERARKSKAERTADTRRKILLGAMLLDAMKADEALRASMLDRLGKYLERDRDRALFNLDPPSPSPC